MTCHLFPFNFSLLMALKMSRLTLHFHSPNPGTSHFSNTGFPKMSLVLCLLSWCKYFTLKEIQFGQKYLWPDSYAWTYSFIYFNIKHRFAVPYQCTFFLLFLVYSSYLLSYYAPPVQKMILAIFEIYIPTLRSLLMRWSYCQDFTKLHKVLCFSSIKCPATS